MIDLTAKTHRSGDLLLSILCNVPGSLGSLVSAFPGTYNTEAEPNWLDDWFKAELEIPSAKDSDELTLDNLKDEVIRSIRLRKVSLSEPVRLVSLSLNYFRGFRAYESAINLDGDLIVLDGPNSSGKTSIAEALEFLITGRLQRREGYAQGNSEELENCIQCQLRPADTETWVEGRFRTKDGSEFILRRVLTADYGRKQTDDCSSDMYLDGVKLDSVAETALLDKHFASLPPLLMQHTLRDFVHKTPKQRREYFERLLYMNEITELINKAVVGKATLPAFVSPTGSKQLLPFGQLTEIVSDLRAKRAIKAATSEPSTDTVETALHTVASPGDIQSISVVCAQDFFDHIRRSIVNVRGWNNFI